MGRGILNYHCKIMDNKINKNFANFYLTQTTEEGYIDESSEEDYNDKEEKPKGNIKAGA